VPLALVGFMKDINSAAITIVMAACGDFVATPPDAMHPGYIRLWRMVMDGNGW